MAAFRWEWFRYSRRISVWLLVGLFVVSVVVVTAGVVFVNSLFDTFGVSIAGAEFPIIVLELPVFVGPFLAITLISIAFGGEFHWGTIRSVSARGAPRWHTVAAKFLLVSLFITVSFAIAYVVPALVGQVAGNLVDGDSLQLGEDATWTGGAIKLFAAWLKALAYLGLGAALTALGRSTAFGLGLAVGILLFESIAYPIADQVAALADTSVNEYTRWTLSGVTSGLVRGDGDLSRWLFLPGVIAYVVLLWCLTTAIITRRDLGSGTG